MIYTFLATGFEEVEALTVVDILRRAGMEVSMVSLTGTKIVTGAHNIPVVADILFESVDFSDAELLYLPGGLPGATNLDEHRGLREVILQMADRKVWLAAVCAGPMVFGHLGLTRGKRCTCYPGFESELEGADYTGSMVEVDGRLVTGRGPAACMELGYTIVELLKGEGASDALREGMMYNQLMKG